MTGLWYSPLHVTVVCGEMQGKFKVGLARLKRYLTQFLSEMFHSLLKDSTKSAPQNTSLTALLLCLKVNRSITVCSN